MKRQCIIFPGKLKCPVQKIFTSLQVPRALLLSSSRLSVLFMWLRYFQAITKKSFEQDMKWDNTLTFVTQVSIEYRAAAFLRLKLVLNTELIMRGQHFMCEIDFMGISMQLSSEFMSECRVRF